MPYTTVSRGKTGGREFDICSRESHGQVDRSNSCEMLLYCRCFQVNEAGVFLAYVVYEEPSARLEWQQVLGPADAGNPSPRRRLSVVSGLKHDLVLPELLLIIVLFIRINIGEVGNADIEE
jgi:hypothetical protein